jgi:hypothetical protein
MSTPTAKDTEGIFEDRLLNELLGVQSKLTSPLAATALRRRRFRAVVVASVAAAVVVVATLQIIPGPLNKSPSASAAPILKKAARTVLATAAASGRDITTPQPSQYVYSVTEDPSGTVTKTWLSADGANSGRTEWVSGVAGEVPATGSSTLAACTLAQAKTCLPEVGYYPDMPTDPSALLAYLNSVGIVNTTGYSGIGTSDNSANDLAKGLMYLLETAYLSPPQRAAIFNLMAVTPGFTIVSTMTDAIGRTGVGVEWTFAGGSGALIFDSTTFNLLGVRTWPGAPNLSSPYDGNSLLSISTVNATS